MNDSGGYYDVIDFLNTRDRAERDRKLHRLPLERYARSDCEYFLTICARHLGEPFLAPDLAHAIIEALLWRRQRHHWELPCYCLMPDHLHFIVRLNGGNGHQVHEGARGIVPEGILEQCGRFKRYTTTQIWWKQGGYGSLWQKSSYDRVIWHDRSVAAAARYVLENPVRKGLVSRWQDYPYAGVVDAW